MKKLICSSAVTLSALAGSALAQPGLYASGLLHQPLGNATPGPVEGRRIQYHNLGSSGQDGVEINMHSTEGGTVALDLDNFLHNSTATIRIRHKGWDGLIYGNHRMVSNGDGTAMSEYDFSSLGATTINVRTLDINGVEVSNVNLPGPICAVPWVPDWWCPNGSVPIYWERWVVLCNTCNPVLVRGWSCAGTGHDYSFNQMGRIIITPQLPAGSPPITGLDSTLVTVSNLPSLTVIGAELNMTGVSVHGVGGAHISEECADPTCATTSLHITNLSSTGLDGVSIDLGDNAGGAEVALSKGSCCRGHVTLMKAFDDEGQEQRLSRTLLDITSDGATVEELDATFPSMLTDGFILTCYGPGGVVIGPPGGTAIISGGPKPVWTNRCPSGIPEIWSNTGSAAYPIWTFEGCDFATEMRLPNGAVLFGVTSFTTQPLNPSSPPSSAKLRHVVITRNGSEMELRAARALPLPPTCGTSDYNGDGDFGTDADIEAFFACLGGDCCPTCFAGASDFNGDGDFGTDADIESFFRVLGGGNC